MMLRSILIAMLLLVSGCDDSNPNNLQKIAQAVQVKTGHLPDGYCNPAECEVSRVGLAMIRTFEGWSATCYQDVAGYWTVGFGHLVGKDKSKCPRKPLSLEEGEALFLQDVRVIAKAVAKQVKGPVSQGQWDALVSWTYNLGPGALSKSTLLVKVNKPDHPAAAKEFGKWVNAGGQRQAGLVFRRRMESIVYES